MANRSDAAGPNARWPWLDGWRGVAVAAMAIYHFIWDLAYFHFVPGSALRSPLFALFGHAIACGFLAIAGFSLAIASRPNLDLRKFSFRLAKIVAAALLVTLATWFAFPQTFVSFGILHCIAAASILSLAFVRMPFWLTTLAGAIVFALGVAVAHPSFDAFNGWLGLGERIPLTNDWRPIFPWAGAMLLGFAFGQFALARGLFHKSLTPPPRALQFAGRHSLIIYLAHQPLLFALVWLAALAIQPKADTQISQQPFVTACFARCEQTRSAAAFCRRACDCVAQETLKAGIWTDIARDSLTPAGQSRYREIIAACRR